MLGFMSRRGPSAVEITLSSAERAELTRRAESADRRQSERARIVLACAEGASNAGVARDLNAAVATVAKWRRKFAADRLDGLADAGRSGRPKPELALNDDERAQLAAWARSAKTAQRLAMRAKIVLRCAEGRTNKQTAIDLGVDESTVDRWRQRFITGRLGGLADEPRLGRPPSILLDQVEDVVIATLESTPGRGGTHWSRAAMAERTGLSKSTIGRIWRKFDLKPHLQDSFKLSTDPVFIEKVVDVVGLYHNPAEKAVALCVDEKSQIQPFDRSRPPIMPDTPQCGTHDYLRHSITSLYAAFDIADGTVISALHRRHRAVEFRKFLTTIDKAVPCQLDVHLVCDNCPTHNTPEIKAWLARHPPRFHVHFTPPTGSSWMNQVERWFGLLTAKLIRRGVHTSVEVLEKDIAAWIDEWNDNPPPLPLDQDRRRDPRVSRRLPGQGQPEHH